MKIFLKAFVILAIRSNLHMGHSMSGDPELYI